MNRADAIVVAYRSAAVINACIRSLRDDAAVDQIIVVNNSAPDSTGALVRACPDTVYVESPSNVGYGTAVNSARRQVKQSYVVLANPDTTQSDDTVSRLADFLDAHSRAGIVAPRMVTPEGNLYRNSQHLLRLPRMVFAALGWPERLGVCRPQEEHFRVHRTEYVVGSFVVARVEALDSVGWFDESIFLFGEDQDLCRRLSDTGWEVWFTPVGRVVHSSGHSWQQLDDKGRTLFRKARYRELKLQGGWLEAKMYRQFIYVRDRLRARERMASVDSPLIDGNTIRSSALATVITGNDRERSATLSGLDDLARALRPLGSVPVRRVLDIGCGFGGLSLLVGAWTNATEVHGVDVDPTVLPEAQQKGVIASHVDVLSDSLPYPDAFFDLVVSFGMLDYLPTFDGLLREIHRVLSADGYVVISLPNLASWHNRLMLLLGYQPRDVEVSGEMLVGALPRYRGERPTGHIHTPTVRAFRELMHFHGFVEVRVTAGSPNARPTHPLLVIVDRLLARRVTLARRFFYVGRKAS